MFDRGASAVLTEPGECVEGKSKEEACIFSNIIIPGAELKQLHIFSSLFPFLSFYSTQNTNDDNIIAGRQATFATVFSE